jgi:diguanylate cyclase (GGDEF)-like protein
MSSVGRRQHAARAAVLFCVAGALAIVNAWIPGICPAELRPQFTALGLLDLGIAAVLVKLPWDRWSSRALLAIPFATLVTIDLFAVLGRLEPYVYSVFLLALGTWVGLALPRWSAVWLAPAVAAAYVLPLIHADRGHEAATTAGVVVVMVVVLAEVIARVIGAYREASVRDELTGVGNRRHGMAALDRLRPGDAVLLLDLDRFKDVNDRDGHAGGDAVLVSLGDLLTRTMRGADAVARLGGEEFLIVASQARGAAAGVAERLVEDWRGTRPRTTLSVGVTVHQAGEQPEDALARADRALYDAKRAGRDRSVYAD